MALASTRFSRNATTLSNIEFHSVSGVNGGVEFRTGRREQKGPESTFRPLG